MMQNLVEKRRLIHEWVENAAEAEVDQLFSKIMDKAPDNYTERLVEELKWRREKHLNGTAESFSRAEVNIKLEGLRRKQTA